MEKEKIKFSVIIPVKEINDYIRDFVPLILEQTYENFEIIILPNFKTNEKFSSNKIRIIPSGNKGPAEKRDLGVKNSNGEIVAFIDDDAYPDKNWLKNTLGHFDNKEIDAVGGPNLTPDKSNFFQKVSGDVLASIIVSGPVRYRYKRSKKRFCEDLPSCNLFIRKESFIRNGGFDTSFWPGEDTKLCLEIIKKKKKIIYDPNIIVYHHRREDLSSYLKQTFNYSKHRGFFAKKYPETSFKLSYFVPTLFITGLFIGLILSYFSNILKIIYLAILLIYFALLFLESLKSKKISFVLPFILTSFLTHVTYGAGFLIGILKKDLKSKYRK